MNSKKIILSIFVIFAIILITTTVAAYYTKPFIKDVSGAKGISDKENIRYLKLSSVSIIKNSQNNCTIKFYMNQKYYYINPIGYAVPHIVIGKHYVGNINDAINLVSNNTYSHKISGYNLHIFEGNYFFIASQMNNISEDNFLYSITDNYNYTIILKNNVLCNESKLGIFAFIPSALGFGYANNIYLYDPGHKKSENVDLDKFELNNPEKGLTSEAPLYPYNLDYAYDVPVITQKTDSTPASTTTTAPTETPASTTTTAPTDVVCEDKCPGYRTSKDWPDKLNVDGVLYGPGSMCYKCNEDKTLAERCNPKDGSKSGFIVKLSSYPNLKTEVCVDEAGSATGTEEPVAGSVTAPKLEFTVFSTIPDISYSTNTATQYKVRKINEPEAYLIDYRNNTKT